MADYARTPLIDRRSLLKAVGAAFVSSLAPGAACALEATDAVYASAFTDPGGGYGIALLSEKGEILHRYKLPGRGHDVVLDPLRNRAVAFARRPGTFAVAATPGEGATVFHSPEGRHFYGHGAFSAGGQLLYASENDFEAARGVIGVYDATDGLRRIGEMPSGGVGPHEIVLLPGGKTMLVANGGIETHPDYGRAKLNLPFMKPNLALVDLASGHVVATRELPPEMHKLSIRHVAIAGDGTAWFACQDQDESRRIMPLAGSVTPDFELSLLDIPEEELRSLRGYVGSVAVNEERNALMLTSPVGHSAVEVDLGTRSVIGTQSLRDVCGVAATGNRFVLSSGSGVFDGHKSAVMWDHHIAKRGQDGTLTSDSVDY